MEVRMHAVAVRVTIKDYDVARQGLRDDVVPRVSQAPGFVSGYWTRSDDGANGLGLVVFESEQAARAAAERIQSDNPTPDAVTVESVEVREVVEHAGR
jgi:hypothetical protein